MTTTEKKITPRHQGRMRFKQTVDKAVSAFLKHPDGACLDYDAFGPQAPNLAHQRAVLAEFVRFLHSKV